MTSDVVSTSLSIYASGLVVEQLRRLQEARQEGACQLQSAQTYGYLKLDTTRPAFDCDRCQMPSLSDPRAHLLPTRDRQVRAVGWQRRRTDVVGGCVFKQKIMHALRVLHSSRAARSLRAVAAQRCTSVAEGPPRGRLHAHKHTTPLASRPNNGVEQPSEPSVFRASGHSDLSARESE